MPDSGPLSPSDRATVAALDAWAGPEALPLLRRFGHQKARDLAGTVGTTPAAVDALRLDLKAQLGPDSSRVHPTWYARALREESEAVRRAVVAGTPEPLRSTLIGELGIEPADLVSDHPADPEAARVALTLWTERLVGDLPARPGDPPAIVALASLGRFGLYRLLRLCGQAKRSILAGTDPVPARPLARARLAAMAGRLGGPGDPRLVQLAGLDAAASDSLGRHRLAGLGLTTLGRLLATADPYRVRWALQHVPYPIAKRLRLAASQPQAAIKAVQAWEGRFLAAATQRLADEGLDSPEADPSRSPLA